MDAVNITPDLQKDQAIVCSGIAVAKLKEHKETLRKSGIRMSLGAIASKAIMDAIKDV